MLGSRSFLSGQSNADAARFSAEFSLEDIRLLDEVGETILPATEDSLGAKAAEIGSFMQEIVSNHYPAEERAVFFAGIESLNQLSEERLGARFLQLSPQARHELLLELEQSPSPRYYQMMKELTLWGYFSSEIGAKQALRHLPVPGRWDPCIEVEPGTKAWS